MPLAECVPVLLLLPEADDEVVELKAPEPLLEGDPVGCALPVGVLLPDGESVDWLLAVPEGLLLPEGDAAGDCVPDCDDKDVVLNKALAVAVAEADSALVSVKAALKVGVPLRGPVAEAVADTVGELLADEVTVRGLEPD